MLKFRNYSKVEPVEQLGKTDPGRLAGGPGKPASGPMAGGLLKQQAWLMSSGAHTQSSRHRPHQNTVFSDHLQPSFRATSDLRFPFHNAGCYQGLLWHVEGETAPEMHDQICPFLSFCSPQTFHPGLRDSCSWVQLLLSSFLKSLSRTPWGLSRWFSTLHKCPLPPPSIP